MKFYERSEVREEEFLICFCDLSNFSSVSRHKSDLEIFQLLQDFYSFFSDSIESNGGYVVKFIGDSALVIFPDDAIDEGVICLKQLKDKVDQWIRSIGGKGKLIVKIHFGNVICGFSGTEKNKKFDVFGENVNKTALLKSSGFSLSVELFRKLDKDTRKLFKKHTPPVTYISTEERHID